MPPRPGSSSGISSAADEEWTLGDVIVTKYKSEKTGVSAYSFVTGNGYLWINSIIDKEGPVKNGASYMSSSRDPVMISIEPSSDPILSVPPGEFSTALTEAQKIARSAISIKVWPLKLLGARRMISDIADGKVRVICGADHMTANVSSAVYDSNDDLSIVTFGSFMEQRCILRMHDEPVISLSPAGNTVFTEDKDNAKRIWDIAGLRLKKELMLSDIIGDKPDLRIARLKEAYGWWKTGKYVMAAELSKEAATELEARWKTKGIPSKPERVELTVAGTSPVTINGVSIYPEKGEYASHLQLDYLGKSYLWRSDDIIGQFRPAGTQRNSASLIIPYRTDYPVRDKKCNFPQAEVDARDMLSLADKLLAAKPEEWPAEEWSKRMQSDIRMLHEGRYVLTYRKTMFASVWAQEVFEGEGCYLELNAMTPRPGQGNDYLMEMKADVDGFSIYDPKNGCLLEVGSEAKLTQNPKDAAAGKKLDVRRAKAMLAYARLIKDMLVPELAAALEPINEYLNKGQLPAPALADVSLPTWSDAYREQQMHE